MTKKYVIIYFAVSIIECILLIINPRYLSCLLISNILLMVGSLFLIVRICKNDFKSKKKELLVMFLCFFFQLLTLITIILYLSFYEVAVVRELHFIFPGLIKYDEYQMNSDFSKDLIKTYYNIYFNFIGSALTLLLVNLRSKVIYRNNSFTSSSK